MTPPAWGIPLVLVLGMAVVAFGWWWDRRRNSREAEALTRPPGTSIPGLAMDDAPAYLSEADVLALPAPAVTPDAEALIEARESGSTLPGGTPNARFLNVPDRGLAAVADPVVLISDAVTAQRVVVTVLAAARGRGRPLVWVAPRFADDVIGTLRANVLASGHQVLPIELSDDAARRRAAAMTGGRVVPNADLLAEWLPDEAWGRCAGWVANHDESWVILDASHGLRQ